MYSLNKTLSINHPSVIRTQRLLLRPWQAGDAEPYDQLNADPVVIEHHPTCLARPESDAQMTRFDEYISTGIITKQLES